jgi:hypothetical protein
MLARLPVPQRDLGGTIVCVLCAVLGVYVVLRRLVLLGVALPQAGAAGIAVFFATGHSHGDPGRRTRSRWPGRPVTFAPSPLVFGVELDPARQWRSAVLAIATAATLFRRAVADRRSGDDEPLARRAARDLDRDLVVLGRRRGDCDRVRVFRRIARVSRPRVRARSVAIRCATTSCSTCCSARFSIGVMTAGRWSCSHSWCCRR